MEIMTFIVHAVKPAILPAIPKMKLEQEDPSYALKGKRNVFLHEVGEFVPVNTYEFGRLRPGNLIVGPAVIEAPTTTMFILSGQLGRVNEYRNLKISEGG
jgi:N-methylhydantoinase A/oxoprolinase/acetone carboxylase beta subunit